MAVIHALMMAALLGASGDAPTETDDLLASLEEIDRLSLEEVLNAPTGVMGLRPQGLRAAPGVVSVVGRGEIEAMGARDLLDVLQRVPGFAFAQDTLGSVGIGFRGMWGAEGKVVVLVDGQEMNEPLYDWVSFGHHYSADLIEKVEVVRGIGAANQGGYAELAVVNVVLRDAESLQGKLAASARYGVFSSGSTGHRGVSLAWGDTLEQADGLKLSFAASVGQAWRSGGEGVDAAGERFSMADSSGIEPTFLRLRAEWRGLKLSYLFDDYQWSDRSGLDVALPRPVTLHSSSHHAAASYALALGPGLTLTPRYQFKRHTPWTNRETEEPLRSIVFYDRTVDRHAFDLAARWAPAEWLDLGMGGEANLYRAHVNDPAGGLFPEGRRFRQETYAAFAQAQLRTPIADLTAAARYEHHSRAGGGVVPRVALTRAFGDLHLKALYSEALRLPGIENVASNPDIEPEHMRGGEIEAGYLVLPELFLATTLFAVRIDKPILYGYDSNGEESYQNYDRTGSCGLEAEARFRHSRAWATVGYSYFFGGCSGQPEPYRVPGDSQALLGFAQHKVALYGQLDVWGGFSVAPGLVFFSKRPFLALDEEANLARADAPAAWLLDLFVTYRGAALRGVTVSAGVQNLLGQRFDYLQPYDGGKPPLRSTDREITLRLSYETP